MGVVRLMSDTATVDLNYFTFINENPSDLPYEYLISLISLIYSSML
jgi:hypothetical protein